MSERGALRCHPMSIDGPVVTFSSFHNVNCKKGFLYFNNEVTNTCTGSIYVTLHYRGNCVYQCYRLIYLMTLIGLSGRCLLNQRLILCPITLRLRLACCHGYNDVTCLIVKVHAVVISEDKVCKGLPKISTTGEEAIILDPVDRGICTVTILSLLAPADERFVYPTYEQYFLHLYSPTVWEPVPNSK